MAREYYIPNHLFCNGLRFICMNIDKEFKKLNLETYRAVV